MSLCQRLIQGSDSPTLSLAKQKLGWEPTVLLQEGLRKTVSCFADLLKAGLVT
jgi:nucleoside-diphosphate-sugar epimerase